VAPSFPLSARIVQLCPAPPRREERVCVIFPAWANRVTAPILPRRGIDLFERVVLGLCQSGIREPDRIAARINLHARLCSHIIDQAIHHRLLDRRRELTEEGRRALRTGSVAEEASWSVRYVFQSPEPGGDLWPRTAERLIDAHVAWRGPGKAGLQLGTPGRPDKAEAVIIGMHTGNQWSAAPAHPSPEQIVEVARLDRNAREAVRVWEFERQQGLAHATQPGEVATPVAARPGPDESRPPELNRITFIDDAEPVLVVGFAKGDAAGSLVAHDPFGVGNSAMLKGLVEQAMRNDEGLAKRIRQVTQRETEEVEGKFRKAEAAARARVQAMLVTEFGPDIRRNSDALGLMTDVDLAVILGGQDEALERVVHATHRLYEELFRRLAVAYPVTVESVSNAASAAELNKSLIKEAAHGVGFQAVPSLFFQNLVEAARKLRAREELLLKFAAPLTFVAAYKNPGHPLYRMAAQRPDLLSALETLGKLRNRVSHGGRDPSAAEDSQWCRDLAANALPELIPLH
jgi:hypothetical protein